MYIILVIEYTIIKNMHDFLKKRINTERIMITCVQLMPYSCAQQYFIVQYIIEPTVPPQEGFLQNLYTVKPALKPGHLMLTRMTHDPD